MPYRHLPPFAPARDPACTAAEARYNESVASPRAPDMAALHAVVAGHVATYPRGVDALHARDEPA